MDKLSYALGMSIAQSLSQSGVEKLDFDDFKNGVKDSLLGAKPALVINPEAPGESLARSLG